MWGWYNRPVVAAVPRDSHPTENKKKMIARMLGIRTEHVDSCIMERSYIISCDGASCYVSTLSYVSGTRINKGTSKRAQ
jgi:hypothetical protein